MRSVFYSVQIRPFSRRCAHKQAIEIVLSTKRAQAATGNQSSLPKFKGDAVLDAKFVSVEDKESNPGDPFDLVVRISCLLRREHQHKISNDLISRYGKIAVESLNVQGVNDRQLKQAACGVRKH